MRVLVNKLLSYLADRRTYLSNNRAYGTAVVRLSSVVVCNGCTVAKRYEIGSRLLLITKRKSHINFQMT